MRVVKESGSRSSDTEEVESEAGTDREAGDSSAPAPVFTEPLSASYAYQEDDVVTDGNLVTSRGPATAVKFALQLVRLLV